MKATKLTAVEARMELINLEEFVESLPLYPPAKQAIKTHLARVQDFIEAAERYLPNHETKPTRKGA